MKINNNKGFTLIELLAVIVVLAIVSVLAVTTVVPFMTNASKDAFATEADAAIKSASNAVATISLGSITSEDLGTDTKDYNKVGEDYCFSISKLVRLGLLTKDIADLGKDGYEGRVVVRATEKSYSYEITMHNKDLYIKKNGGTVKGDEVVDYDKETHTTGFTCESF